MGRSKKPSGRKPEKNHCVLDDQDWCTHAACEREFNEWEFDEFSTQYVEALEEDRKQLKTRIAELEAQVPDDDHRYPYGEGP